MIRRLWSTLNSKRLAALLRGEPADERVRRSATGCRNRNLRVAWSGYVADRGLLVLTVLWLGWRLKRHAMIAARPDVLYEPGVGLARLVFPSFPSAPVYYGLFALTAVALLVCFLRPRLVAARAVLAVGVVLIILPEFGYGKVEHINHLFLAAHVYAVFLPVRRPARSNSDLAAQAEATHWYQAGLLFIYTMAGLWKFFDLTIRYAVKGGMTWLNPDAMVITSITSLRGYDFPLIIPRYVAAIKEVIPLGYVMLAFLFAAAFLAAFRRPYLLIVLPTIAAFHLMNIVVLYVLFASTIAVALVLFLPYDRFVPAIQRQLDPFRHTRFRGRGAQAQYRRRYANGDEDVFRGFYAYREHLRDRSWLMAAPLYYPGLAWITTRVLRRWDFARAPAASE
jgi:hypothetical protein